MICPFCNTKNIQSRLIYQDKTISAFPSNIPIVPGHTLVCPRRHLNKIDELSDYELIVIKKFIVDLKKALSKCFNAKGFNIAWNEGKTSGQSVPHLHIHVLPRKPNDQGVYKYDPREFLYRPRSRQESPTQELEEVAKQIQKSLAR